MEPKLKTLTKAEFRQTKAGRRKGASYQGYLRYLANERPKRVAARATPIVGPYARPGDVRTARTEVAASVQPAVRNLTADLNRQAKAGGGAIAGYTNQLANNLGGYEARTADIYGDAAAQQATADSALVSALRTGSMDQANQLAEQLRSAGLDISADQMAPQAQQVGSGAAGALQGTGSASLSQLLAEGASARNYAAGLPGLARLGGQQGIRDLRLANQAELAGGVRDLRSQVPGLVQERLGRLRDARYGREADAFNRSVIASEFGLKQQGIAADAAAERADALRPNASLSRTVGYVVDSNGTPILRDGKLQPTTKAAARKREGARQDRSKQFLAAREDAFARARQLAKGRRVTSTGDTAGGLLPGTSTTTTVLPSYQEALSALWTEYGPLLTGQGYPRQAVEKMLRRALAAAGLKPKPKGKSKASSAGSREPGNRDYPGDR